MSIHKPGIVTVELLDATISRPIHTWTLNEPGRITIGRAVENDVPLSDSYVSRLHVELCFNEGEWTLYSHGRNGTLVEGISASEIRISDGTVFQLGSQGPTLRFVTTTNAASGSQTMEDLDPEILDNLILDKAKTAEEVKQIVERETFQALKKQVENFKREKDHQDRDS